MNVSNITDLSLWHRKYGHAHKDILIQMTKKQIVDGLPNFCEPCVQSKLTRLPYPTVDKSK